MIILTVSTISQVVSAPLLNPQRWFECTFDPNAKGVNKKKCSKDEKKKAIVGSIIGGATVGTAAAAGAAAYGGYKGYKQSKSLTSEQEIELSADIESEFPNKNFSPDQLMLLKNVMKCHTLLNFQCTRAEYNDAVTKLPIGDDVTKAYYEWVGKSPREFCLLLSS